MNCYYYLGHDVPFDVFVESVTKISTKIRITYSQDDLRRDVVRLDKNQKKKMN